MLGRGESPGEELEGFFFSMAASFTLLHCLCEVNGFLYHDLLPYHFSLGASLLGIEPIETLINAK